MPVEVYICMNAVFNYKTEKCLRFLLLFVVVIVIFVFRDRVSP